MHAYDIFQTFHLLSNMLIGGIYRSLRKLNYLIDATCFHENDNRGYWVSLKIYLAQWNIYYYSIENKCFGGDCSILLEFAQFLDMFWCIFFHKNQSFCLRFFAEMHQTSTKVERPFFMIFYSSQIQHFLVFQQDFRYKEMHIKW